MPTAAQNMVMDSRKGGRQKRRGQRAHRDRTATERGSSFALAAPVGAGGLNELEVTSSDCEETSLLAISRCGRTPHAGTDGNLCCYCSDATPGSGAGPRCEDR